MVNDEDSCSITSEDTSSSSDTISIASIPTERVRVTFNIFDTKIINEGSGKDVVSEF